MSLTDASIAGKTQLMKLICDVSWSNTACCGYVIKACENLSYSRQQTKALLAALDIVFTNYPVGAMKEYYTNY